MDDLQISKLIVEKRELENLIIPLISQRKYRYLKLSNGLKIVLVSDLKNEKSDGNTEQMAAASLSVNVGYFSDPEVLQGRAHYLEHMVFMGSEKYPKESSFHEFISQHGGQRNAYTEGLKTQFFFSITQENLSDGLDLLGNFFIAPLLKKDAMDRELTAVHSEYEMARTNDSNRMNQLISSFAKEGSPYRKFGCGCKKSLYDEPKSKNVDIYSYLQDLRKEMYSANLMSLCVFAKTSLDDLEKMVVPIFSQILSGDKEAPNFTQHVKPFENPKFNRFVKICPLKNKNILSLVWSLPSNYPDYKCSMIGYISSLVGHESPGSIISHLRSKNLAVNLSAGCYFDSDAHFNPMNALFIMHIEVTEEGLQRHLEVISAVFAYLQVIGSEDCAADHERCFNELKLTRQVRFRHRSDEDALTAVNLIAQNLQIVDDLDWLLSAYQLLGDDFNSQAFHDLLSDMTVNKACILLSSKTFEADCCLEEPWFGAKYQTRELTGEELETWSNPPKIDALHLPDKNIFLSDQFALLDWNPDECQQILDLSQSDAEIGKLGKLFFKAEVKFRQPKASIKTILWTPIASESARSTVLHNLLHFGIDQNLMNVGYFASEAGFKYNVSGDHSLTVECFGFDNKIQDLYFIILEHIRDFTLTQSQFASYKEILSKRLSTSYLKPFQLARAVWDRLSRTRFILDCDLLRELKDVQLEDLLQYRMQLVASFQMTSYIHGNISVQSAKSCFMKAAELLRFKPDDLIERPFIRQFPEGDTQIAVYNMNPSDVNTAVLHVYQVGAVDLRRKLQLELLSLILSTPAFDYLRTKETLGYSAGVFKTLNRGIGFFVVYVQSQSSKFSLQHCETKMRHFVDSVARQHLDSMEAGLFNDFRESMKVDRRKEDTSMTQEIGRNFHEIVAQEFLFDRRAKELSLLDEIQLDEVRALFTECVDSARRRCLHVLVESCVAGECPTAGDGDLWNQPIRLVESKSSDDQGQLVVLDSVKAADDWPLYPDIKVVA